MFTWRRRNPEVACRLDYFLISQDLKQKVSNVVIKTAVRTDHQAVVLTLTLEHSARGPGTWCFNNSLCKDEIYRKTLIKILEECHNDFKGQDDRAFWDLCKMRIKEKTIKYCQRKAQIRSRCLISLESSVCELEREADNEPNPENVTQYEASKRQLDQFYKYNAEGAKIRSKVKHYIDGEKSTKYVLSLEKINNKKHTIKSLRIGNEVLYNSDSILRECRSFYQQLYNTRNIDPEKVDCFLSEINIDKALP